MLLWHIIAADRRHPSRNYCKIAMVINTLAKGRPFPVELLWAGQKSRRYVVCGMLHGMTLSRMQLYSTALARNNLDCMAPNGMIMTPPLIVETKISKHD
jgi:hypothetical protein